jgi:iron complex transport system permease protein
MLFWLMGDASFAQNPGWALVLLAAAVFGLVPWLRDLDLLPFGEISAQALGVPVAALRITLLALASLLTATAVTLVGSVGFVGLIVPHALRLVIGANHRWLLPMAALAGGTLLTAADTLARTAWAPHQLPVGIAMALIGVPFFLWLLARTKGG